MSVIGVVLKELARAGAHSAVNKYGEKVGEAAGEATVKAAKWLKDKVTAVNAAVADKPEPGNEK